MLMAHLLRVAKGESEFVCATGKVLSDVDRSVHLRFDQVDVEGASDDPLEFLTMHAAEFGILTNTGSSDVNLTGYTVQDLDGGNQSRPFGECSVAAGKSVTIWTCPGQFRSGPAVLNKLQAQLRV